jgi:nucleotidyltransferase substrate binding protein (TIGR01987 family)
MNIFVNTLMGKLMDESRLRLRFANYRKSLKKLRDIVTILNVDSLTEIERDSLIKRFELTFELSWNVLKDFLALQGETELYGSRNTFRTAFQRGLISNGGIWMQMIESRIQSAHTYDEESALRIAKLIYSEYLDIFNELEATLSKQLSLS